MGDQRDELAVNIHGDDQSGGHVRFRAGMEGAEEVGAADGGSSVPGS